MKKKGARLNLLFIVLLLGSIFILLDGIEINIDKAKSDFMEWSGKKVQFTRQSIYALIAILVLLAIYLSIKIRIRNIQ